jgi:hypothetical protein
MNAADVKEALGALGTVQFDAGKRNWTLRLPHKVAT